MTCVIVFSGTTEGRVLSESLRGCGAEVRVRVATEYGSKMMDGSFDVDVGPCGGAEGVAKYIRESGCTVVADATHPYARTISSHVRDACATTGAKYIRVSRSESGTTEGVVTVSDVQGAVDYLKGTEGNILVTTGSKEADRYTQIDGYKGRVFLRVLSTVDSVRRCSELGFEGRHLIAGQGPYSYEANLAVLRDNSIRYMVTKDSGREGGFEEKIEAAIAAGVESVVIGKPEDEGISCSEAVREICDILGLERRPIRREIRIIGTGMGFGGMTERARRLMNGSDVIYGAERMIETSGADRSKCICEYKSENILAHLDSNKELKIASVLVSGDVGFYSGAKKIVENIDASEYDIRLESGVSSVQHMASMIGMPWQDAFLTSAHGKESNLVGICDTNGKVFTLLSDEESVHSMCREFIEYGIDSLQVFIAEDMGYPTEKLSVGHPSEVLRMSFGKLCAAMVINDAPNQMRRGSIRDDDFIRGDAPMTKSEVRTLSVSKLHLDDDSIVYDIGAGTGSVSIELAMSCVDGKVYAIEKEDIAADLIEQNKRKFRTSNVEVIRGKAPDALQNLPAPTHVFIGGSSGNMKSIIGCVLEKNSKVRIVINYLTLETVAEVASCIEELGLVEEETIEVSVSKAKKVGRYHLMNANNPIFITVVNGS